MKTTVDFLDAVKQKRGLTSDYQLSKHLGCTHSAISNYRMKKNFIDEVMAVKVATDLGLSTGYVLSCIASERAKKPEVKAAWAYAAQMLSGVAACALIVLALPYSGVNSGLEYTGLIGSIAAAGTVQKSGEHNIHYAYLWHILKCCLS
jgi:transcriptional regulator with XRE-family HTH domain